MRGRHEVPKRSDPFIGAVVLGLTVLLGVTIILTVA